jgi:integrase
LALLEFEYIFWHNPAKINKAGLCPISLRLTLGGQRAEISTKLRCTRDQWDSVTHRLYTGRGAHPSAKSFNQALDVLEGKVVLLRASLPAGTTLAELRAALQPTPEKPAKPAPPAPCALALLQAALLRYSNAGTRAAASGALSKLRAYAGERLPLPELTSAYGLRLATHLRTGKGAEWTLALLRGLYALALPDTDNPFPAGKMSRSAPPARVPYILSKEELAQMAALVLRAGSLASRARDIYLTQYYLYGSRVGVVMELTWAQVDWEAMRVTFKAEKRAVWHDVEMRPALAAILRSRWPGPEAQGLVFDALPANFFAQDGDKRHRLRKSAASKVWRGLQSVAQLLGLGGRLHSHTARHSLATHTVEATGDYRLAQRFMGHSTLQMTERYVRPMLKSQLDAGADAVYGD